MQTDQDSRGKTAHEPYFEEKTNNASISVFGMLKPKRASRKARATKESKKPIKKSTREEQQTLRELHMRLLDEIPRYSQGSLKLMDHVLKNFNAFKSSLSQSTGSDPENKAFVSVSSGQWDEILSQSFVMAYLDPESREIIEEDVVDLETFLPILKKHYLALFGQELFAPGINYFFGAPPAKCVGLNFPQAGDDKISFEEYQMTNCKIRVISGRKPVLISGKKAELFLRERAELCFGLKCQDLTHLGEFVRFSSDKAGPESSPSGTVGLSHVDLKSNLLIFRLQEASEFSLFGIDLGRFEEFRRSVDLCNYSELTTERVSALARQAQFLRSDKDCIHPDLQEQLKIASSGKQEQSSSNQGQSMEEGMYDCWKLFVGEKSDAPVLRKEPSSSRDFKFVAESEKYLFSAQSPQYVVFRIEFHFIWVKYAKDSYGQSFENYNPKIEIFATVHENGGQNRASKPIPLKSQYLQTNPLFFRSGYLGTYEGPLGEIELYTKQSFYNSISFNQADKAKQHIFLGNNVK